MRGKEGIIMAAAAIVVAAAGILVYRAFTLRMEEGDAYEAYSTFRSDPMGARLFHDALANLPEVTVERNTASVLSLERGGDTTIFFAGAYIGPDPQDILAALEGFAATGGRIVIAFRESFAFERFEEELAEDGVEDEENAEEDPEEAAPVDTPKEDEAEAEEKQDPPTDEPEVTSETEEAAENLEDTAETAETEVEDISAMAEEDISERWGFGYHYEPYDITYPLVRADRELDNASLPETVPWLNHTQFEDVDERWTPVYAVDGQPVVIERSFGRGSIVVCSDSFFISNEVLREHNVTGLLSWLVGTNHRVVFDETHLGNSDQQHLVRMAAELRLHGFIALLLVLGILYVWQQVYTLVPRRDQAEEDARRAEEDGLDAASALTSLLRRSVSKNRLLGTCFQEWENARGPGALPETGTPAFEQARKLAGGFSEEGRAENVIDGYGQICAILREARRHGGTQEGRKT